MNDDENELKEHLKKISGQEDVARNCTLPVFLCDTPGGRPPCLHERASDGQRTANGFAVSCPWYRGDRGRFSSPIRL